MGKKARSGVSTVAVAYIRRSTSRQDLSPSAQADAMTQWAMAQGVTIVATFCDTVSGSTPTEIRPGWTAALEATRTLGAGVFLVAKRDRIGRDALHVGLAGRAVTMAGAALTSADGNGNGTGAADVMVAGILDAVAAYELACIRTRTREALAARRARGSYCPPTPRYGFARVDGALVPDPAEQAVLEAARALRADGRSLADVCHCLAAAGHLNRRGKPFQRECMWAMLRA